MTERHSTQDSVPHCEFFDCDRPATCRCHYKLNEGYYCDHHFFDVRSSVLADIETRFSIALKKVHGSIAIVTALLGFACWWWHFGGHDALQVRNLIGNEANFIIASVLTVVFCYSLLAWSAERYRYTQFQDCGHWNAAERFFSDTEDEIERREV